MTADHRTDGAHGDVDERLLTHEKSDLSFGDHLNVDEQIHYLGRSRTGVRLFQDDQQDEKIGGGGSVETRSCVTNRRFLFVHIDGDKHFTHAVDIEELDGVESNDGLTKSSLTIETESTVRAVDQFNGVRYSFERFKFRFRRGQTGASATDIAAYLRDRKDELQRESVRQQRRELRRQQDTVVQTYELDDAAGGDITVPTVDSFDNPDAALEEYSQLESELREWGNAWKRLDERREELRSRVDDIEAVFGHDELTLVSVDLPEFRSFTSYETALAEYTSIEETLDVWERPDSSPALQQLRQVSAAYSVGVSKLDSDDYEGARDRFEVALNRLKGVESVSNGTAVEFRRAEAMERLRTARRTAARRHVEAAVDSTQTACVRAANGVTQGEQAHEAIASARAARDSVDRLVDEYDIDVATFEVASKTTLGKQLDDVDVVLDALNELVELRERLDQARQQHTRGESNTSFEICVEVVERADRLKTDRLEQSGTVPAQRVYKAIGDCKDDACALRADVLEQLLDEMMERIVSGRSAADSTRADGEYQREITVIERCLDDVQERLGRLEDAYLGQSELWSNTPVPTDRVTTVQSEVTELEQRLAVCQAVSGARVSLDAARQAYDRGDYERGLEQLDAVDEYVETALTEVDSASGTFERTVTSLETQRAECEVVLRAGQVEAELFECEELVETEEYSRGRERLYSALTRLDTALETAQTHGLDCTWELQTRRDDIERYIDAVEKQLAQKGAERLADANRWLDRAESLVERAVEKRGLGEHEAATEALTRAREVVDQALDIDESTTYYDTREIWKRATSVREQIKMVSEPDTDERDRDSETENRDTPQDDERRLLEEITQFRELLDEPPRKALLEAYGSVAVERYEDTFESWKEALERAGCDPQNLPNSGRRSYTNREVLDELRRVADELDRAPKTTDLADRAAFSAGLVSARFDGWKTALYLAGLTDDSPFGPAHGTSPQAKRGTDAESPDTSPDQDTERIQSATADGTDTRGEEGDDSSAGLAGREYEGERDLARRDMLLELVELTDRLGRVPDESEITEHGTFESGHYEQEFGDLFTAFREAGVFRDDVTRDQFDRSLHTSSSRRQLPDAADSSSVTKPGDGTSRRSEDTASSGSQVDSGPDASGESFATIGNITTDARLERAIAVNIRDVSGRTGDRKQASLLVEDTDGDRCRLNIWQTHDIDVTWQVGHWYVLEPVRGKVWTNNRGDTKRQLSSTSDLRIDHVGPEITERVRNPESSHSTQNTSESDDETAGDESGSGTILEEVVREFEDLSELENS